MDITNLTDDPAALKGIIADMAVDHQAHISQLEERIRLLQAIPMPEIVLNQPRIRALVGQGEAARVAEHVGMGGQGDRGRSGL